MYLFSVFLLNVHTFRLYDYEIIKINNNLGIFNINDYFHKIVCSNIFDILRYFIHNILHL